MVPGLPATGEDRLPGVSVVEVLKIEMFPFLSSLVSYQIFCKIATQQKGITSRQKRWGGSAADP